MTNSYDSLSNNRRHSLTSSHAHNKKNELYNLLKDEIKRMQGDLNIRK